VPGIGAIISPLFVPVAVLWLDLPVQALLTVLVLGFLYLSPRGVKPAEACLLLAIYAGYVVARMGS
jgi:Ca2+/Na+ antiporter